MRARLLVPVLSILLATSAAAAPSPVMIRVPDNRPLDAATYRRIMDDDTACTRLWHKMSRRSNNPHFVGTCVRQLFTVSDADRPQMLWIMDICSHNLADLDRVDKVTASQIFGYCVHDAYGYRHR